MPSGSRTGSVPRRVVCLQPGATVTLAELHRLDRIVACTRYCADLCPEVRKGRRAIVADSWTAKSEEILAARPDLVIASVPYQAEAVQEILKAGIPFLGLAPKSLDDIYADISLLARVMGAERRGAKVVARMKKGIAAMRARASTLLLGLRALAAAIRPDLFPAAQGLRRIATTPTPAPRRISSGL
jgi:iron complex transport system substrate-binding protein